MTTFSCCPTSAGWSGSLVAPPTGPARDDVHLGAVIVLPPPVDDAGRWS